jgi:hypothetical protein
MAKNPYLTPWIIPRWSVMGFCDVARGYDNFYVSQIIEHDPTSYLIITYGNYPLVETDLKNYLQQLWS